MMVLSCTTLLALNQFKECLLMSSCVLQLWWSSIAFCPLWVSPPRSPPCCMQLNVEHSQKGKKLDWMLLICATNKKSYIYHGSIMSPTMKLDQGLVSPSSHWWLEKDVSSGLAIYNAWTASIFLEEFISGIPFMEGEDQAGPRPHGKIPYRRISSKWIWFGQWKRQKLLQRIA